jgi:hypothetical protein
LMEALAMSFVISIWERRFSLSERVLHGWERTNAETAFRTSSLESCSEMAKNVSEDAASIAIDCPKMKPTKSEKRSAKYPSVCLNHGGMVKLKQEMFSSL